MNYELRELRIRIWERKKNIDREDDDPKHFQADIIGPDFDHHGIGETPASALVEAALHWRKMGR